MKAEKITLEEAKKLPIGTVVNFGDGKPATIKGTVESKHEHTRFVAGAWVKEFPVFVVCEQDGRENQWVLSVLTEATLNPDFTLEKCDYCGAIRPTTEIRHNVMIFVNRGRRYHKFCNDDSCAGNYQMGCEG